jgi:hypothetical protein
MGIIKPINGWSEILAIILIPVLLLGWSLGLIGLGKDDYRDFIEDGELVANGAFQSVNLPHDITFSDSVYIFKQSGLFTTQVVRFTDDANLFNSHPNTNEFKFINDKTYYVYKVNWGYVISEVPKEQLNAK